MSFILTHPKLNLSRFNKQKGRRMRTSITIQATGEVTIDRLDLTFTITQPDGVPLLIEVDEEETDLDAGETQQLEIAYWSKHHTVTDAVGEFKVVAYSMHRIQLPTTSLQGEGALAGSGTPQELRPGVFLHHWSIFVEPQDDDGDCRLTGIGRLNNTSEEVFSHVKMTVTLFDRKNREIDQFDSQIALQPNSEAIIDGRSYIKATKAAKPMRAEISLDLFQILDTQRTIIQPLSSIGLVEEE